MKKVRSGQRLTLLLLVVALLVNPLLTAPAHAQGESYTISGTVRDYDNTPVEGAFVSTDFLDPEMAFATTDSEGNYTLTVSTPGTYYISVSYFYNRLDPLAQTVAIPPSHTTLDFTFTERLTLRGIVSDPEGAPIEGAVISTGLTDPLHTSVLTDANGAYTLPLLAGIYYVTASKSGLVSPPTQRMIVPPSRTEVNFALYLPYTIQGTVYTYDGKPASGITVASSEDDPMSAFAMSDSNGDYTLVVRAGTYHLYASFPGLGTTEFQVMTVPDNLTGVDFQMPQQYLIHGTVRDETGQPIAGATVHEGASRGTTTAIDGSYTLSLVAGEHRISVYHPDDSLYDRGFDTVMVSVPPVAEEVDFFLQHRTRTISGRVVDNDGLPLGLVDVFAINPINSTGQSRATAADGSYSLEVPPGVYWVYASKRLSVFDPNKTLYEPTISQELDVTDESAQEVNFALTPLSGMETIRGRVQNAQGGPIDAMISAAPIDPYNCLPRETVWADESGFYTITVKPSAYSISVFSEGMPAMPYRTVQVPSANTVDFTYPEIYAISGRVMKGENRPLRYALVRVTTSNFDGIYNSEVSDSDGWYTLLVGAGTYTVSVYDQGYANPPVQVVTVPGDESSHDFLLSPVAPPDQLIQGRVVDENGQPAPNAVISIEGEMFGGKTVYHDGAFTRILYPGSYRLSAGGYGYVSSPVQEVTVPGNQSDLTFTVRRANHTIFGQVTDQVGKPLCSVTVEAVGKAASTTALTDSNGRFAMLVPDGTFTVRAAPNGYPTPVSKMITVPQDDAHLQLILAKTAVERSDFVYLPTVMTNR